MDRIRKVLLVHGYNGVPEIFKNFKSQLEATGCEVAMPDFPVRENISVEAYFAVFDQYREFLSGDTAVIAHSIGNGMLLKYLAERNLSLKRYIALAGFASPFVVEGKDTLNEKVALINLSEAELAHAREEVSESFCIFSNNDHLVPYDLLQAYPKQIGGEGILIENIGHMGHKTGLTELPGAVELATGEIRLETSCGCIVLNDKNEVLLEREISRNGDRFWAFPKGHMEAGETEIQTAIRETKEEVGLDVEIFDEGPITNNYFLHDGKVLKRVPHFLARPVGEAKIRLQAEEVEQARFMSLDEARALADFEYTRITIDEVKERMGLVL